MPEDREGISPSAGENRSAQGFDLGEGVSPGQPAEAVTSGAGQASRNPEEAQPQTREFVPATPPTAEAGTAPGQETAPPPPPPPVGAARRPAAARTVATPGRRTWFPWVAGGCLGCLPWILLLIVLAGRMGSSVSRPLPGGEKVGLIYVEGTIIGGRGAAGLFGISGGADDIVRQLERARRDRSIRAVVLRINSPGGSAAASQEIYEEVMRLRHAGKPVVASMGDVAASGGYYVASAADKILANGSTMTGSIGVIMELQNLQGLFNKIGVGMTTVKSGKFKDIGSPTRPLTAEERALLQNMVNDVYEQFVNAVIDGRKSADPAQIRRLADGRIFTGRQALKLKLVDGIGNLPDATTLAAKMAGIRGIPTVTEIGRRSFLDLLSGSDPGSSGALRLPGNGSDEERLVKALRQLLQQQAVNQ